MAKWDDFRKRRHNAIWAYYRIRRRYLSAKSLLKLAWTRTILSRQFSSYQRHLKNIQTYWKTFFASLRIYMLLWTRMRTNYSAKTVQSRERKRIRIKLTFCSTLYYQQYYIKSRTIMAGFLKESAHVCHGKLMMNWWYKNIRFSQIRIHQQIHYY